MSVNQVENVFSSVTRDVFFYAVGIMRHCSVLAEVCSLLSAISSFPPAST